MSRRESGVGGACGPRRQSLLRSCRAARAFPRRPPPYVLPPCGPGQTPRNFGVSDASSPGGGVSVARRPRLTLGMIAEVSRPHAYPAGQRHREKTSDLPARCPCRVSGTPCIGRYRLRAGSCVRDHPDRFRVAADRVRRAAARTRGVAAGRSAQRACERSSDWRRGAAGSPDPDTSEGIALRLPRPGARNVSTVSVAVCLVFRPRVSPEAEPDPEPDLYGPRVRGLHNHLDCSTRRRVPTTSVR